MRLQFGFARLTVTAILVVFLASAGRYTAFAEKCQTYDASAMGTSTQMGKMVQIKVRICAYSSPEDRQILVDAFLDGQSEGLTKALEKMKPVGRISLPGTTGYDIAFARVVSTPTGKKIRFITDRKIAFGESYRNTQSQAFSLTAGEFDLNKKDKGKSTGVLFPATQLVINADGEVQLELNRNPWKLSNIIYWDSKDKE
jgi:hypothetical protein